MSKEVNLVTFHPHAWGEKSSYKMNAERNPDVPDSYHQAIIIRNAAAKAAQDYERTLENKGAEANRLDTINEPQTNREYAYDKHDHTYDLKTLTCIYCGKAELNDL